METISISNLKAHLSSEIRKVRDGVTITVMDHNHPVAQIIPFKQDLEPLEVIEANREFKYKKYPPLIEKGSVLKALDRDRADRW